MFLLCSLKTFFLFLSQKKIIVCMVCYGRRMIDGHTQKRSKETWNRNKKKTISWMVINAFFFFHSSMFMCFQHLLFSNISTFSSSSMLHIASNIEECCIFFLITHNIFFSPLFWVNLLVIFFLRTLETTKIDGSWREKEVKIDLPSLEIHYSNDFESSFFLV